jgi:hypothetical protein
VIVITVVVRGVMDEIGEVKNTVKHNSDPITKEQYPVLN